MTLTLFFRRYWRIPVVALLGALIAFGASFIHSPTYVSTTRLLIQPRSSTLLDSTGSPISSQPGLNEPDPARTLSETYSGIASSRQLATLVVDELHLDRAKPAKHGVIHWFTHAGASAYAHAKAWISHGFYKEPNAREKAIEATEAGVKTSDLAPAGGSDTGQSDSYILELDAAGDTAIQSQQIANASADALIAVSKERFAAQSKAYAAALERQLDDARSRLAADNQRVSAYEVANHLSVLDVQLVLDATATNNLQSQIMTARATVAGDKETVASLQQALQNISQTAVSRQDVTTGRSSTAVNTTEVNPVYQTVAGQLTQAQATLANDNAKLGSLSSQQQGSASTRLTQAQAGLQDLEQQVTADQNNLQSLATAVQQADQNIALAPADLSRLGTANLPTYPTAPKRYIYLLLGLLIGGLGGYGLTYLARRRRRQPQSPVPATSDGQGPATATVDADRQSPALIPAGLHENGAPDRGNVQPSSKD